MCSDPNPPPDYKSYTPSALISRIHDLESQLASVHPPTTAPTPQLRKKSKPPPKPFDPSRFHTRLIALKFSYLGQPYNGFEHANGTVPPKPTIEEVLWKALRKTRLISPVLGEDADESMEVVWDAEERRARYRTAEEGDEAGLGKMKLEVNWEGCEYSKCGRTDRGVSAFGQVVGVRVRSKRPKVKGATLEEEGREARRGNGVEYDMHNDSTVSSSASLAAPSPFMRSPSAKGETSGDFDPIHDELPYISILNAILPPSIRILAWCPHPPADFDARFSCKERQYKYFFTNPAFLPTPGPLGMQYANGSSSRVREGWLDIQAMREAAKKLEGSHDYRNLCKIDPSKQMSSCERRIGFADVSPWTGTGRDFVRNMALAANGDSSVPTDESREDLSVLGPQVYCFSVHGSAFLWHQVRCMVAVLFLVGQGLEIPEVVDELLDISKNPRKPMYEMADDGPLVLWDCVFDSLEEGGRGKLNWIYAGDEATLPSLATKNDGKFGLGGLADTLWTSWRKAKLEETVTGGLLDLALSQGDATAFSRGGFRDSQRAQRSQKIFDGGDNARVVGPYTPMASKQKMETLEEQNDRYRNGRGLRKSERMPVSVDE